MLACSCSMRFSGSKRLIAGSRNALDGPRSRLPHTFYEKEKIVMIVSNGAAGTA